MVAIKNQKRRNAWLVPDPTAAKKDWIFCIPEDGFMITSLLLLTSYFNQGPGKKSQPRVLITTNEPALTPIPSSLNPGDVHLNKWPDFKMSFETSGAETFPLRHLAPTSSD